ncbi:hypothetical protein [Sphingomonas fuzhouensis]|uniref:hypothetical protein n=1 Tax=Sphingomonas fuzhouensis TaxID=3106033 RepID=UPI002AFDE646|nr:hypothetical protein [Sphingomonas sp. SGZ-02]
MLINLAASPVLAQDETAVRQFDELQRCKTTPDDHARLACYDRAATTILASRAAGDLMVLDRKTVIARKQSRFGLAVPTGEMFGGGKADDATAVRQLDSSIRAVKAANAQGRWNMELANGSVWQTIDTLGFPPDAGDRIVLKEAPLGGYRASVAGGRSILVKRIR